MTVSTVLIVDDEEDLALAVKNRLQKIGYTAHVAHTIKSANESIARLMPDIVLLDVRMPDGISLDMVPDIVSGRHGKSAGVLVMTAQTTVEDAVRVIKDGATDYIKKPFTLAEIEVKVDGIRKSRELTDALDLAHERDSNKHQPWGDSMLGESQPMHDVRAQIVKVTQIRSAGNLPTVLITGETGTGKDVTARAIHALSENKDRPFVHVDCAAIPKDLIETELFGHERGSFTGASASKRGYFEQAENGSIFLDEIGELPIELQSKLLHALERRMIRKVGGEKEIKVGARIIAATNRNLDQMVVDGKFRGDLYFRLNVIQIKLPTLRERGNDILMLAEHALDVSCKKYGYSNSNIRLHEKSKEAILKYRWPGNVRELINYIERAVLFANDKGEIRPEHLGLMPVNVETMVSPTATIDYESKEVLLDALKNNGWNVMATARALGIGREMVRSRMRKHGLVGEDNGSK